MHLRLTPSTGSGAGDDELRCNVQHGRQPTAQRAVRHAPQRVLRLGHPGVAAEHEAGDKLQRTCCWLDNPLPLLTLHWVGLVHAPSKTPAATVHCCMRPEIPHVHCRSTHRSTSTFCSLTAACVDHICHHTGQRFVPVPPHWLCAPLQLGWSDTNPLVQSMSCSCCCTHPACRRHFHAGSGTVSSPESCWSAERALDARLHGPHQQQHQAGRAHHQLRRWAAAVLRLRRIASDIASM